MNKTRTTVAVLLAGLLASAGVYAQTYGSPSYGYDSQRARVVPRGGASATTNVPQSAGEASTMTNGVPNVATYNPNPDEGRVVYPRGADIARVPQQAGEASTMVNGRPNWEPNDPLIQRQQERAMGFGTGLQPSPAPAGTSQ